MRAVRIIAILVLVYAGLVVAFESLLGYYQPSSQGTIVITTTDADVKDRSVADQQSGVVPRLGSGPVEESAAEEAHITLGGLGDDLSDQGRSGQKQERRRRGPRPKAALYSHLAMLRRSSLVSRA